jgi:hypothetical protein
MTGAKANIGIGRKVKHCLAPSKCLFQCIEIQQVNFNKPKI